MDLAALYRLHGAMVLRRSRRLLRDDAAAQDVVQDVFLKLHECRHDLQQGGLVSWLYVVTTNLCLHRLRAMATRARLNGTMIHETSARARGADLALARSVMAALPEELATVAVYRFIDEMTHAEIAELLGCSRRHVGDLLVRFEAEMESNRRLA